VPAPRTGGLSDWVIQLLVCPATILSVRSLSVNFGSNRVVKSLSFDVYPGKTIAIVGESAYYLVYPEHLGELANVRGFCKAYY
jgi:hypothetical protein